MVGRGKPLPRAKLALDNGHSSAVQVVQNAERSLVVADVDLGNLDKADAESAM